MDHIPSGLGYEVPTATHQREDTLRTTRQLAGLRADFDRQNGRSLSLPAAGLLVWTVVGGLALFLDEWPAILVLVVSTGLIFPVALALSSILGERILSNTNPLATLMGLCVLMVNLLWAVHLTMLFGDPEYLPLTLGIGLGLHWIVFSWIVQHPVGIVHAILRTVLVTSAWWLFPDHRVSAVAAGVVTAYAYSVCVLATRTPNTPQPAAAQS